MANASTGKAQRLCGSNWKMSYSKREFVEYAFNEIGVNLRWEGEGEKEVGIDLDSGKILVSVDPKYYRPAEVEFLLGDPTLAKKELGWEVKSR